MTNTLNVNLKTKFPNIKNKRLRFAYSLIFRYFCAVNVKTIGMRNLLALAFCAIVALLMGACAKDYSREAAFLKGDLGVDSVTILKTKEIKAYNPAQDNDNERVQVWSYTHMKFIQQGDFNSLVDAFEANNPNSDATVVEYKVHDTNEEKATILFSIDGGYYQSLRSISKMIEDAASEQQSKIQQYQ